MPSPQNSEYAATTWGQPTTYELTCPSGQKCLLRKIDPFDMLETDLLDKLDFVTSVVMNKHVKNANMGNVERIKAQRAIREGKTDIEAAKDMAAADIMNDPKKLKDFKDVMDSVLVVAVVAPSIKKPPADQDDRVEGVVYTDTVDFSDKMAVFEKVMEGVKVAERFRGEPAESVAAVAPQPGVRKPAVRRTRAKKS
jgi:hypothetical protein